VFTLGGENKKELFNPYGIPEEGRGGGGEDWAEKGEAELCVSSFLRGA